MQTEVLRLLRADAQSWWRYRELRRTDYLDEARRQERQTIRRDLGYLRKTLNNPNAYVSCGRGGTILHLGLTTVSLYAPVERFPLANLAVRLGTPLIDGQIDPKPWTSSSRIPLLAYLDAAERLGARIINDPRTDITT